MSRWLSLVLILVWLPAPAQEPTKPPLSQEQRDQLKERDRLREQITWFTVAGKLPEAITAAEKLLVIERAVNGNVHPSVAETLMTLAGLHEQREDYPAARATRQELLAVLKKLKGEGDWQVTDARLALEALDRLARMEPGDRRRLGEAQRLMGQAVRLYQRGQAAEALPLAQQAAEITKQVLGERHPDHAKNLHNLAFLYKTQRKYTEAEPLFRQAVAVRKQVLGEGHPAYATSVSELASVCAAQRKYAEAEALFRQALEINHQARRERQPDYGRILNNLATLYQDQGKYAEAEPLYQQSLAICKQAHGEQHPDYATCLRNLAEAYEGQGKYAEAEPLCQQALAITKQALGERHPVYALNLNNLAGLYQSEGKYAEAARFYRQALEIQKEVPGERHPDYATTLNNLALVFKSAREYALAEPFYRQALQLRKQVLGERHPDYASSLNNLGALYAEQEKYDLAEPLYREALEIEQDVLGKRHPNSVRSVTNLAVVYKSQGKYAVAEALYRQAIAALCKSSGQPPVRFEELTATDLQPLPLTVLVLASYCVMLEQRLGPQATAEQLRSADRAFALTLAVRERLRQEVLQQDASKLQHGAEALDLIPRRIGLCRRLFEREGRAADLETAFATAEQATARLFLEQLGKARAYSVGRVSPELRRQEAELRRTLRDLDARIAGEQPKSLDPHTSPEDQDQEAIGRLLVAQQGVESQLNQLIGRLEREYPQYAALKYPKPCSLDEARACLSSNEVALLFVPGDQRSYVILLEARPAPGDKNRGLAVFPLPRSADLLDGVSGLTDPEILARPIKARAHGVQAYALLLESLHDRIQGKDLVIVPGGSLAYVPFELLVEEGQYLMERHRIRYAPSLTVLHLVRLWEKDRTRPPQPLFALGDPNYDAADPRLKPGGPVPSASPYGGPGEVGFHRLDHSRREVEAIARLLHAPWDDVWTGPQALEAKIKEASASGALGQARYVHLATHGILGVDVGQPPALVLSLVGNDGQRDADGGINDGFLRLDEVTRLQLNADLVVLSACQTGQGRLYQGEGVTGLARAFLYAGSRGVVASLWNVDDAETANLMTAMYGALQKGSQAADALREAKLRMIRAGTPPLYWAPFILMGE